MSKGERGDGGAGSCQWTFVVGWKFLAVPLWKSVKNGLTRKAELGVEVARAGTLWPWSPHWSRMGYLSYLISCLLLQQITKKYYFSMLFFAIIAILTF